jgi:hypothetical protein
MSFPFTYTGKIKCNGGSCSDTGAFYSDFLRRAGEKFAKAKAETVVFDNKLSFRIKAFPYWFNEDAALLAYVPSGILFFDSKECSIKYILNFHLPMNIISALLLLSLIFVPMRYLFYGIEIAICVWVLTTLIVYISAIRNFRRFLNRILKEHVVDKNDCIA